MMGRVVVATVALVGYAVFLVSFSGLVVFASGLMPGFSVDPAGAGDGATRGGALAAVAIDVGLALMFGVTHSVMARPRWKRLWSRGLPAALERSAYVLVASVQLLLVCGLWQPVAAPDLWRSSGAPAAGLLALGALGWATALAATFSIDHLALFGLRQGLGLTPVQVGLRTPLLYRVVRHPLYLGILVGLWAAPVMTASHALLAGLLTAYVLVGIWHEERDLVRVFGPGYVDYQARVPMLLPLPRSAPPLGKPLASDRAPH